MERRPARYDPDERFRIETDDPEETLRRLLNAEDVPPEGDEPAEAEDS